MKYDSILYVPIQDPTKVVRIYYKLFENMEIRILPKASNLPFPLETEKASIILMIKSKESPNVGK